jgi:MFS family permease
VPQHPVLFFAVSLYAARELAGEVISHSLQPDLQDSPYACLRLAVALALMTIGGVGMYSMPVALSLIQAEFGVDRAAATLPYTLTMIGFGLGGILMGRLADRFGVIVPVLVGASSLGIGFLAVGMAPNLPVFTVAHGLLIGLGCSGTFAPLVADISMWFTRHRGIAVAVCASGNYLAGAVWPPVLNHFFEAAGWRATFVGVGLFALATALPLALLMRRRAPLPVLTGGMHEARALQARPLGLSPNALTGVLAIAGVACCVAMAMPQVHIVAYCGDLGYGAARGSEMLSVMLASGVVSRLFFGWISDRIGGIRTLLAGSILQGIALVLFLPFDGLVSLYVVSALFGLFQGGLVPAYAIIIREYFAPGEAGLRVGIVIMATLFGMALGGWMSGALFDFTGSYRAAFINGIGWNLLNLTIAVWLLRRAFSDRARRTLGWTGG